MRTICCIVLTLLAVVIALAQTPFGNGFETGTLTDYLDVQGTPKGVTLAPAEGVKGRCLQLAKGATGTYAFRKVPVEAETKYLLRFLGKVIGGDVIEKNSRLDIVQVAGNNLLPRWQVQFFGADGKPLAKNRSAGFLALVSANWRPYTDVFYTPTGAVAAQVAFLLPNAENGMSVDDCTFGPCPDEGAINCNPDFRYGPQNYAGWASLNTGALLVAVGEGKYGLDTAYGSSSDSFPLRQPGTYRLSARGTTRGGFRTVDLRIYDDKGALIKVRNIVGLPNGNSVDFLLPDGAASGSLLVYNHILEDVRVIRMGDANKLAELDAERAAKK